MSVREDDAQTPSAVSRFDIVARPDPQTLARLINYFAQRALTPHAVECRQVDGMMRVSIEQAGLSVHEAGIIADKMRNAWLVEEVALRCGNVHQMPLSEAIVDQAA